jgi:hypothetical protein
VNAHQYRVAQRAFKRRWPLGRRVTSRISGNEATIVGHYAYGRALKLRNADGEVFSVHADYLELAK